MLPLPTEFIPWRRSVQRPVVRRLSWTWIELLPRGKCFTNSTKVALYVPRRGDRSPRTLAAVDVLKWTVVPRWRQCCFFLLTQKCEGVALSLVMLGGSESAAPALPAPDQAIPATHSANGIPALLIDSSVPGFLVRSVRLVTHRGRGLQGLAR